MIAKNLVATSVTKFFGHASGSILTIGTICAIFSVLDKAHGITVAIHRNTYNKVLVFIIDFAQRTHLSRGPIISIIGIFTIGTVSSIQNRPHLHPGTRAIFTKDIKILVIVPFHIAIATIISLASAFTGETIFAVASGITIRPLIARISLYPLCTIGTIFSGISLFALQALLTLQAVQHNAHGITPANNLYATRVRKSLRMALDRFVDSF